MTIIKKLFFTKFYNLVISNFNKIFNILKFNFSLLNINFSNFALDISNFSFNYSNYAVYKILQFLKFDRLIFYIISSFTFYKIKLNFIFMVL